MNTTQIQDAIKALEKKIAGVKGSFTLNDAATITGLAVDEAKEALDAMMSRYVCRLMVTDNGDLIYSFGSSLQRRGERTFAEKMELVGDWAWKAFTVFFKAWIAVTLVVYFVIFLVMLVALLIAASQGGGKDRKSPVKLDGIFNIFFSIFQWRTATRMINYQMDRDGYRYRQYEPKKSYINEQKKSFIASVYDFVFGPERVQVDPLANAKEVAAYLRKEKGIVTPAELIALAGWKIEQAEAFLSDCIVRFKGDPVISDNGVVYGKFDQITRGTGEVEGGKIELYWDEYEPEYEITGNKTGRNALIVFMNLFNLVFASAILGSFYGSQPLYVGPHDKLVLLFLGWLPVVFSFLFFAVPLGRVFKVMKLRRQRVEMNKRKRIMRVIFKKKDKAATLDEIMKEVNTGSGEKALSSSEVEACLDRMMKDFQGEIALDADGKARYSFYRIAEEYAEAERIRSERKAEDKLGDVIFDSKK
jgi:hypothetical protein